MPHPPARTTAAVIVSALLFCLSPSTAQEAPASDEAPSLGALFRGTWDMAGRFRYSPEADWIPTKSVLRAESTFGNQVVLRRIEAPQIDFEAIDLITYNPRTKAAQYIYVNSQDTSALVFEGRCTDRCREMTFEQVCGPAWTYGPCNGSTSITFESANRFVARDYRPSPEGGKMMTREVTYTRRAAETGAAPGD